MLYRTDDYKAIKGESILTKMGRKMENAIFLGYERKGVKGKRVAKILWHGAETTTFSDNIFPDNENNA